MHQLRVQVAVATWYQRRVQAQQQRSEDEWPCEGGHGCKEAIKKRKAEEEHPEDPERDDGKWMRTNGNKRKAGEESEESRLRNCEILEGIGQDGKQGGVRQNAGDRGSGGS